MFEVEYKRMMDGIAPAQELLADALAKERTAEQGKRPARRVRGAAILAAVLLLGTACAAAIGIPQMILVNWQGSDVSDEMKEVLDQKPAFTPDPSTNALAKEIAGQAPDNELWIVHHPQDVSQSLHVPIERVDDLESLAQRISRAQSDLLSPSAVPDGYALMEGNIHFFASFKTTAAGIRLYSEENTPEGFLIRKFSVPDTYLSDIEGYYLMFENGAGNRLTILAGLQEKDTRAYFPVYEGRSEQVSLPGMDQGIYIHDQNNSYLNALYLHKSGLPGKAYRDWTAYTDMGLPSAGAPAFTLEAVSYSICADALPKEQLITIAENMR